MWFESAAMLVCVAVAVAINEDEKPLSPVIWKGGWTKMNDSRHHFNGLATRAQIFDDDAFVCIPRLKEGIEATLLKIPIKPSGEGKQLYLEPYPGWKSQTEGECSCLQSVADIFLDPTEVLWALDTGRSPHPGKGCPPKVVAYHLSTGQIAKQINLTSYVRPDSKFQFIVADFNQRGECYIYITDAGTGDIIVYDITNNRGYPVNLMTNVIKEHPKDDVMYMLLVRLPNGQNLIYFTYRSSEDLMVVNAQDIQSGNATLKAIKVGKKPGKMILLGTDDWECIYFRYENETEVYKWNSLTEFTLKNFQMVHKSKTGLTPTQALTDYNRGVMRVLESNIVQHMTQGANHSQAINSLDVMLLP